MNRIPPSLKWLVRRRARVTGLIEATEREGLRLKQIRAQLGVSQKEHGILAGLDQFVASTRISRYELGVHKPDFLITQRLAEALDVPAAYFYAEDGQLAELMIAYHRASRRKKAAILKVAKTA